MADTGDVYIVATPIGNMKDMTGRAIEVLSQVDLVAAEDTRHSRRLLDHYAIRVPLMSLHEHNERARCDQLLQTLQQGQSIALISDAGTPLISDPGAKLVEYLREASIRIIPIPGPCAAIAALSVSGLDTHGFVFEGFLPAKGEKRSQRIKALSHEVKTVILYESVHRIDDLLQQLALHYEATRRLVIARELTKHYETVTSLEVSDVAQGWQDSWGACRGEFVVMIAGCTHQNEYELLSEQSRVLSLLLGELSPTKASRLTSRIVGGDRNQLYKLALSLQSKERK